MSKLAVVFTGFSLKEYIQEARSLFPADKYEFICIKGRHGTKKQRDSYLPLFDYVYQVDAIPDTLKHNTLLVTCTQERDMNTYLHTLLATGFIDAGQHSLWSQAIDKQAFKEKMTEVQPGLTPRVSTYDATSPFVFPSVIKPTNLTGSAFVHVVQNQTELDEYMRRIDKYTSYIQKIGRVPKLVAEEFVQGKQYSVNAYINADGDITYCPLIRVIPAFELGQNDTYTAVQYNTTLPEDLTLSLHQSITTIVETFRIKRTSAHFDCILSPTGWKICEVGLRIGGNRQRLFEESHGFSHFKNDLYNRIGKEVTMGQRRSTAAVVQKAPDRHGHLHSVHYPQPHDSRVSMHIEKQKTSYPEAGPVGQGGITAFRAFLSGDDEATVVASAKRLFEQVNFEMD